MFFSASLNSSFTDGGFELEDLGDDFLLTSDLTGRGLKDLGLLEGLDLSCDLWRGRLRLLLLFLSLESLAAFDLTLVSSELT